MRCYCCNRILTPAEATRKFKLSGEFTDTCSTCLTTMDVDVVDGYVEEGDDHEEDGYLEE
jgi:hypothetical protein